jgi:regulator of sigma D
MTWCNIKQMIKQTTLERINMLQRQVAVHSIIYYDYNDNIWTDEQYDNTCKELVSYMSCPEFPDSCYYEFFKDFDGSTGFHLVKQLRGSLGHIAYRIWRYHNGKRD